MSAETCIHRQPIGHDCAECERLRKREQEAKDLALWSWPALLFGLVLMLWAASTHAFQVCWQGPTHNTDGTPLPAIERFTIYSGRAPGEYDRQVFAPGEPRDGCANVRASEGQWFVVMTATDPAGVESAVSNEVVKIEGRLGGPAGGRLVGPTGGTVITSED